MTDRGILKKYFCKPDIAEQVKDEYCFVCGTPFLEEKWEEERVKALTSLKAYYKEELMKKLESMNYKSCCCLKYMNLAIEEVLE